MEIQRSVWHTELILPPKLAEITPLEGLLKFKFTGEETTQLLNSYNNLSFVFDTKVTFYNGEKQVLTSGAITVSGGVSD